MGEGWGGERFRQALILTVLVGLIRWLFTGHSGHSGDAGARSDSKRHLDILKERYARGDIDRDIYDRMRRELES
ncbi:MAG: electron transporter RnfE [Thiomonas sp. 15-66-11]|jgi:putative membrane protein|nr:MAG: electron transporter RnfE [Thiomonas sp. 15-66-11]OZB69134.1 MAG: electron transporter RnfE [Thiomonas sp. 13-64-67]